MENLKLYVGTFCPFCKKVEKFIESNNITGVEIINIDENPQAIDELVEIGGKKQVPALNINGEVMYESLDIINYLNTNKGN